MRAGLITGLRQFELIDVPEPEPRPAGVVVEVKMCGICGSDIHAYVEGWDYSPQLCGHEWFGEVVAVGKDAVGVEEGDVVMAGISAGCGACHYCVAGHPQYCRPAQRNYTGLDDDRSPNGGFAPLIGLEASRLAKMPQGITPVQGALVEPTAVAFHAVRQSLQRPGDVVVVVGAGPIGQLTAQCAKLAGAGLLIVVEPDERRRERAGELGADVLLDGGPDTRQQVRQLTSGLGADVAFDAAGVPQTLEASINLVRRGGSVCMVGVSGAPTEVRTNRWMTKEITITTSLVFTIAEATRVGSLIMGGRLKADALHEATITLDDLPATIEAMANKEQTALKVLVDPSGA
ncbi:MAG: (R,R)-butanediol dehydrogenase/meso-butanediol dehydrogenase/diacetyl reductase [Acidimicrobiales bacterium]|jgi:(R,R)-butanediol dehydrogenase/meso-butanediol dehydrogenase/diacetyl reductase